MSKRFTKQYGVGGFAVQPGVGTVYDWGFGAPTGSIQGYAKACLFIDITNGIVYQNTGSATSATWTAIGGSGGSVSSMTITTLTATTINMADGGVIVATGNGFKVGNTSNDKVGYWGATPIVQPASTGEAVGSAGLGSNGLATVYVLNTSNFNGNTGNKNYTINDIVKALKTAGILAASG